ncbi:MAG TPA: MFS transporter [Sporichthya sp.]|nr:MFS transporter [Sporichthya sp.]
MSDPRAKRISADHPHYKWVALSNTTLGMLISTINASIVLISLPAIFQGIGLDPLEPANVSYLLWMLMGYMLVTAVLVVSLGRMGDIFGRVRIYNAGFAIFTVTSILLSLDPLDGGAGALWLIGWRVVQAVGGAMLMANSAAIVTDAFPATQRGMGLGVNMVSAIAGSFLGLVLGGVLSEWNWRSVFWVNVPVGIVGTVWAYRSLQETGVRKAARMDWWGNLTFAAGLTAFLAGITYGIQPYGGHTQGWTNPWVLAGLIGGAGLLVLFVVIETKVTDPLFPLDLFRSGAFTGGNAATLLGSIARGGLQFMLIIWLQGIWLPLHGYNYEDTPLWAGIYLLPLTLGFLVAGPLSGHLSDRFDPHRFAAAGFTLMGLSFAGLLALPTDFPYWSFALMVFVNGLAGGLYAAPNASIVMSSAPADARGAASGMRATFQNAGMVLSIGVFFSLLVAGLSSSLPDTLHSGLTAQGVSPADADAVAAIPPVGVVFSAFLGYNPIQELLGDDVLNGLPQQNAETLTGRQFFPHLISGPFHDGLLVVFTLAIVMSFAAAALSLVRPRPVTVDAGAVTPPDSFIPAEPTPGTPRRNQRIALVHGRISGPGGHGVSAVLHLLDTGGARRVWAFSGPDGAYTLSAPTRGTYVLVATAPGHRPHAATVELAPGLLRHDATLARERTDHRDLAASANGVSGNHVARGNPA